MKPWISRALRARFVSKLVKDDGMPPAAAGQAIDSAANIYPDPQLVKVDQARIGAEYLRLHALHEREQRNIDAWIRGVYCFYHQGFRSWPVEDDTWEAFARRWAGFGFGARQGGKNALMREFLDVCHRADVPIRAAPEKPRFMDAYSFSEWRRASYPEPSVFMREIFRLVDEQISEELRRAQILAEYADDRNLEFFRRLADGEG